LGEGGAREDARGIQGDQGEAVFGLNDQPHQSSRSDGVYEAEGTYPRAYHRALTKVSELSGKCLHVKYMFSLCMESRTVAHDSSFVSVQ